MSGSGFFTSDRYSDRRRLVSICDPRSAHREQCASQSGLCSSPSGPIGLTVTPAVEGAPRLDDMAQLPATAHYKSIPLGGRKSGAALCCCRRQYPQASVDDPTMHSGDPFGNGDYVKLQELGHGAYGVVYKARRAGGDDHVAVKVIKKSKLARRAKQDRNPDVVEVLVQEIAILRELRSDFVVRMHEVYQSTLEYHLVMELIVGGELFDRIAQRESFTEEQARALVKNLIQAIAYLHASGVVHRDIKPEK